MKCIVYISGRGVPQNFGKLLSVPWVKQGCGALL